MSKSSDSNPKVVHLKKWKALRTAAPEAPKKKGPDPVHRGSREAGVPAIRKEVDPESIRSAWIGAFGRRLKIDEQTGFYLDGRPIGLDALMLETNRIRRTHGLAPVGRNPKWFP